VLIGEDNCGRNEKDERIFMFKDCDGDSERAKPLCMCMAYRSKIFVKVGSNLCNPFFNFL